MNDDLALTLSISEINKRLTRNARERERLRILLHVAVQAREDAERFGAASQPSQPEAARSEEVTP